MLPHPRPRSPSCEGTGGLDEVILGAHNCVFVVTMGVAWTVEGTGLPPPGHTGEVGVASPGDVAKGQPQGRPGTAQRGLR